MAVRSVLCFGDSNTHGTRAMRTPTDKHRHPKPQRWPSVMATALGEDWDVIAEGHPGRTTVHDDPIEGAHKNGFRVLHALLESHRPLDLVILMLGTNDLKARFGLSAHDIMLGVQRLVGELQRSDCGPEGRAPAVLVVAPVAVSETGIFTEIFAQAAAKSAELPNLLCAMAARSGAGFVDLNPVASIDPVDGIHLDAQAHAAIGAQIAQAVQDHMENQIKREIPDA